MLKERLNAHQFNDELDKQTSK